MALQSSRGGREYDKFVDDGFGNTATRVLSNPILMKQLTVDTTGSAGVATGSTISASINGIIEAIQVDYHASAPATTDVTITSSDPSDTILSLSNQNTDVIHYPRTTVVDNSGTAANSGDNLFDKMVVNGTITVSVAQCDALTTAVEVRVFYR